MSPYTPAPFDLIFIRSRAHILTHSLSLYLCFVILVFFVRGVLIVSPILRIFATKVLYIYVLYVVTQKTLTASFNRWNGGTVSEHTLMRRKVKGMPRSCRCNQDYINKSPRASVRR